jgi:hypothetical protein
MSPNRKSEVGTDADCRATDPKLTEDWICPEPSDVCISIFYGQAAYCCPGEKDCTRIAPVPRIELVGPFQLHQAHVKPDNISFFMQNWAGVKVQQCGNGACPRGYNCQQEGFFAVSEARCVLINEYAITPNKASAPGANLTFKATKTNSPDSSTAGTPLDLTSQGNTTQAHGNSTNEDHGDSDVNTAIIAGATLGAAVGIVAIVLAAMIYLRYMRKTAAAKEEKGEDSESGASGELEYWSYDGRREANGRLSREWSDSTLR